MDGDRSTDNRLAITGYNHFAALFSVIIVFVLFMLLLIYVNFDIYFVIASIIGFFIDSIPAFYLHWEYWAANRGMEFTLVPDKIIRNGKDGEVTFFTEEMDRIVVYKSASIDKGGIPILAIESYHYARIYLKSGEELIITCLLTPDVTKAVSRVKGVPIKRKNGGFNSLRRE